MEAALGLAQLETSAADLAWRRQIAARLTEGLAPLSGRLRLPATREGCEHAWMFYPMVLLGPEGGRPGLIQHLEDRQVETRYLLPLLNQPAYVRRFGALEEQYPVARDVNHNGFYVGCHAGMTMADADHIVQTIHDFFRSTR
jgi:dTDP-4-amino-4,6-dideoxygalactose transaminase